MASADEGNAAPAVSLLLKQALPDGARLINWDHYRKAHFG